MSDWITQPSPSPLAAPLAAGLEVIDNFQVVPFVQYTRFVLPLDGFVFWVRSDLTLPTTQCFEFSGSVHYATAETQAEDESYGLNRVTFTTTSEIQDLNCVGPTTMYLGTIDNIRFAFSRRESRYYQSGLYHYVGDALYPALASQVIDTLAGFDQLSVVVSNSLPIWLSLVSPVVPALPWLKGVGFPIFPSFAVPDNMVPPYASVHIVPDSTQGMQMTAWLDSTLSHWQLCKERVRITFYGLRHAQVIDFLDYVTLFSRDTDAIGIFNVPVPRDEKRAQSELSVIAMKKTMEFEVTYNQYLARQIARQLILSCVPTFSFD